jgi:hypothetical protein
MELVAWVWEQCEDFGSTVVGQQARPAGFVTRPALRHDQGIFNVTRKMFKKFELNLQDKWWTWMHTFIAMAMNSSTSTTVGGFRDLASTTEMWDS